MVNDDILVAGSEIPIAVAVETRMPYTLIVTFKDGTVAETVFEPDELTGVFAPMRDPAYFATAFVDPQSGTVAWPNGIDLDPCVLYDPSLRDTDQAPETQKMQEK